MRSPENERVEFLRILNENMSHEDHFYFMFLVLGCDRKFHDWVTFLLILLDPKPNLQNLGVILNYSRIFAKKEFQLLLEIWLSENISNTIQGSTVGLS